MSPVAEGIPIPESATTNYAPVEVSQVPPPLAGESYPRESIVHEEHAPVILVVQE